MLKDNRWLDSQVRDLDWESKNRKVNSTSIMFRFLFLLIPMFIFAISLNSAENEIIRVHNKYDTAISAQWRCSQCGMYNYSETPDWMGRFYCDHCGQEMGK